MPEAITAFIPAQRESHAVAPVLVEAMIDLTPGGLMWRRTFPGTEDQVQRARQFVRYLLADSSRRDDAELVVAELATNAIRHTGSGRPQGTFIVELARTTAAVTVAVYDCGWGGVPRFGRRCRFDAVRGRGLVIVAAVADDVGHEGDDQVGHRVWATLTG